MTQEFGTTLLVVLADKLGTTVEKLVYMLEIEKICGGGYYTQKAHTLKNLATIYLAAK